MKKEYDLLTDEEKLKHWEAVVAHKIRSQAEVSDAPGMAISDEFVANCLKKDRNFLKFTPLLSITFPELKKYVPEAYRGPPGGLLKKWTFISSLIFFAGIQVLLLIKSGTKALIFIGIVDGVIGSVYYAGVILNRKLKKMYRQLAERTGLEFRYSEGVLPGFLYYPVLGGVFNGFHVYLSFRNKWTGRWSRGQIGLGQAQTTSRSTLSVKRREPVSSKDQKKIFGLIKNNHLNGDILFENNSVNYEMIGAVNSKTMQDELIKVLEVLTVQ